jgi:hypothetical protein
MNVPSIQKMIDDALKAAPAPQQPAQSAPTVNNSAVNAGKK